MTEQSFATQHRGTKMTNGLLFIILSLLLNDAVHSKFEVVNFENRTSWEKASHHCKMSTPAVNLTTMRVIDKIALKEEAWVGYFQTYEHFLFIACVPLSVVYSYVSTNYSIGRVKNRPGICYSLCGLQGYIALQDGLCYCIAKWDFSAPDTQPFNNSCEKPLHCGNGMLCGDQDYSKITVYVEVTISSHDIKGDDSGCLRVTKGKTYKMSVVNCSRKYRHLCEHRNGHNLYLEESIKDDQWVYSVKDCAETGKRPTTFIENRTHFIFPKVSGSWWTSVVRDLVIRNCSERGHIIYPTGNRLCNSKEGKVNEASTPSSKGAEPETMSKETAVLMVLLPVRLTALVLIAVVALIIVCRKRRKGKTTIPTEAPKQTTTEAVVPRNAESHQTYYEHDNDKLNQQEEIDQGHVSSEYDTFKEHNALFSALTGNLYDTANFNIGDGIYDAAFSENNPRQAVQANSYDHLRLPTTDDGKYDHVDIQDLNITLHQMDTYDQANAFALDNAYYENF